MQRYIQQLIEDLEQVANNPPPKSYVETPPHLAESPEIAELALVPFKPISEWTGIKSICFPEMIQLTAGQCNKVNEAIFKVFKALYISLIDLPDDIPPEILYDALTTNWDQYVQYLPLSGHDFELCSGDPDTCPYEAYCDCGEPPDFTMDEPPDLTVSPDDEVPF
jgi:hypothetical protein